MPQKNIIVSVVALSCMACSAQKTDKPNVILINLDDAGYGDFGCYGAEGYTTPHIDRLAENGIRFTRFYAAQPVSGASRAALLTGCYSNRVGLTGAPSPNSSKGIAADEQTLGELMQDAGYSTAIIGKWHLGDKLSFMPLRNGFDEFFGFPYSHDMWPKHPQNGTRFHFSDLPLYDGETVVAYNPDPDQLTTRYTERALDFIVKHKEKPFFLYLAHSMPHVPLGVSEKFKGKSQKGLYGDVMMEIDWSVGEIMNCLRSNKLEKNTIVILTSDNGPWLDYGNHAGSTGGLRGGKHTTFEGGNRVPCIVQWKGHIQENRVSTQLMANIDLLPTIVALAHGQQPVLAIDGLDFSAYWLGKKSESPRKYLALYNAYALEAVTDGTYKLIFPHVTVDYAASVLGRDGQPGVAVKDTIKTKQLYFLSEDEREQNDVRITHAEAEADLETFAAYMRKTLGDKLTHMPNVEGRKAGKSDQ